MLRMRGATKKTISGALACAALSLAAGSALAGTPFQNDVTTSINLGIEYLANANAFTGGAGDATGLATQALLEKRASGNPADPPSGYTGASVTDKGRLRTAATYMINQTDSNGASLATYRDGQRLFALAGYALTGGPDKSVLGTTITIKQAMDNLTDKIMSNQNAAGILVLQRRQLQRLVDDPVRFRRPRGRQNLLSVACVRRHALRRRSPRCLRHYRAEQGRCRLRGIYRARARTTRPAMS